MSKMKRLAAAGVCLLAVFAATNVTLATSASAAPRPQAISPQAIPMHAPATVESGCLASCGCDVNVKIRSGPGTGYTAVGLCAQGDFVNVAYYSKGNVPPGCTGPTSNIWDYLTDLRTGVRGWVTDCYISEWA
jgi:uncharacterized protein YraI